MGSGFAGTRAEEPDAFDPGAGEESARLLRGSRHEQGLSGRRANWGYFLLVLLTVNGPLLAQDVLPPAEAHNLSVNLSGPDLVLTWDPVTTSLLGSSETVSQYRVYRGTTPGFIPDKAGGSNLIGTPTGSSFTDPGAGTSTQAYFYLVSAVDSAAAEGNTRPSKVTTPPSVTASFSTTAASLSLGGAAPAPQVGGYRVVWGSSPATYSSTSRTGNVASTSVFPLAASVAYYIAVFPLDTQGNYGGLSNEVSGQIQQGGGPTTFCGTITTATAWNVSGSPYVVTCNVLVQSATLTIAPGVIVKFAANAGLTLGNGPNIGILSAQGTAASPIIFTSNQGSPTPGYWNGINFPSTTSASVMDYVAVEYGGAGGNNANIRIASSAPALRHSVVQLSDGYGVTTTASTPILENNAFQQNGLYPLHLEYLSFPSSLSGNSYAANGTQAIELVGGNTLTSISIPNEGIPYVVTSSLQVNYGLFSFASPTLTLTPGVTLKFAASTGIDVGFQAFGTLGILVAQGTASQPVTLTSASSTPVPGQWGGVNLQGTTPATMLDHVVVEYGGAGANNADIKITSSTPTVRNSTIRLSDGFGITATGAPTIEDNLVQSNALYGIFMGAASGTARPSVQRNTFVGNTSYPLHLEFLNFPSLAGNSYSGNGVQAIELTGGSIFTDVTIPNDGVPYLVGSTLTVNGGSQSLIPVLTLGQGVTLKFAASTGLDVGFSDGTGIRGVLNAQGSVAQPVTLTSASTTPAPGQWNGVGLLGTTPATLLDHAIVEYGGAGANNANLKISSSTPTVRNSTIRFSDGQGITATGAPILEDNLIQGNGLYGIFIGAAIGSVRASVQRNTFTGNGSYPLHIEFLSFPSLSGNVYTANGVQAIEMVGGGTTVTMAIPNDGVPYLVTSTLGVGVSPSSMPTLTLAPGVTLKFAASTGLDVGFGAGFGILGVLSALGTAAQPITFTTASVTPAPGQWNGLNFLGTTAASILDHVVVEYGGAGGNNANIRFSSSAPTLQNSTVQNSDGYGVLVVPSASPRVIHNSITNNALLGLNATTYTVAHLNYWGSASGPSGVGTGTGNGVSANVRFEPWLASPPSAPFEWDDAASSPDPFSQAGSWASFAGTLPESGAWTVEVRNSGGALVKSLTGTGPVLTADWYGDDGTGTALPNGIYNYQLLATSNVTAQVAGAAAGQITLSNTIPVAKLTSPIFAQMSPGGTSVAVTGSASGVPFQSYRVDVGVGEAPVVWTQIGTGTTPVSHGVLASWNTTGLTAPLYSLRLSVTASGSNAGDQSTTRLLSIQSPAAAPTPFSPNGDGKKDTIDVSAVLSYNSNWTVNFADGLGTPVKSFSGTGLSVAQSWDGRNTGGQIVPSGPYTYQLQVTDPASGVTAFSPQGPFTVDLNPPSALISSPQADQTVYQVVPITGTADDSVGIASYLLEFGAGTSPSSWSTITLSNFAVVNGLLSQWATKQLISDAPGEQPLHEQGIANDLYTVRLTVTDRADNSSAATVQVNTQNLFISNVQVTPRKFDPLSGETASISGQLSLDTRLTAQIFSRSISDGAATLVRTLADNQLWPAGSFALAWDGKNDGGVTLPLKYYTFKITGTTPGGERTAVYDRFFRHGVFQSPNESTWMVPIPVTSADAPGGLRFDYTLPTLSRIGLEVLAYCQTQVPNMLDLDEARLPGSYSTLWDFIGAFGESALDVCVNGMSYVGSMLKSYPLPENTVLTESTTPKILSFYFEPAVFKPAASEIVTISYTLAADADTVNASIRGPGVITFHTFTGLPTTAGTHTFTWDGMDDSGLVPVRQGPYAISLNASITRSGVTLGSGRSAYVVVLGDYRVDASGHRIFTPLSVVDATGESGAMLLVTSVEGNQ